MRAVVRLVLSGRGPGQHGVERSGAGGAHVSGGPADGLRGEVAFGVQRHDDANLEAGLRGGRRTLSNHVGGETVNDVIGGEIAQFNVDGVDPVGVERNALRTRVGAWSETKVDGNSLLRPAITGDDGRGYKSEDGTKVSAPQRREKLRPGPSPAMHRQGDPKTGWKGFAAGRLHGEVEAKCAIFGDNWSLSD